MNLFLRHHVVDIIYNYGYSISDLEQILNYRKVKFERDELRKTVWRLAAEKIVEITPESIIVKGKKKV